MSLGAMVSYFKTLGPPLLLTAVLCVLVFFSLAQRSPVQQTQQHMDTGLVSVSVSISELFLICLIKTLAYLKDSFDSFYYR